jgi:hypothetical protein
MTFSRTNALPEESYGVDVGAEFCAEIAEFR